MRHRRRLSDGPAELFDFPFELPKFLEDRDQVAVASQFLELERPLRNAFHGVALRLRVTEDAIKGHMKNILAKLQANDRTHAVTIAFQRGIIEL